MISGLGRRMDNKSDEELEYQQKTVMECTDNKVILCLFMKDKEKGNTNNRFSQNLFKIACGEVVVPVGDVNGYDMDWFLKSGLYIGALGVKRDKLKIRFFDSQKKDCRCRKMVLRQPVYLEELTTIVETIVIYVRDLCKVANFVICTKKWFS